MEAKELRIGNNVHQFGLPIFVTGAIIERLQEIEKNGKTCIDITPIRLNEEVFDKMGWDVIQEGWFGKGRFTWNVYDKCLRYNGQRLGEPNYLHNVQNIYWELCNEELSII